MPAKYNKNQKSSPTRRTLLKGGLAFGLTAGVTPFAIGKPKPTLRVMGTHVTLQEDIRQRAMEDLGINIAFEPGGSARVLQKASMLPNSFDLYEQWSNSINVLWRAQAIQPIEKKRLLYWEEINNLTKTGKLTGNAREGAGDAPQRVQPEDPPDVR